MESLAEIVDMECEGKVIPLEVMKRLNQSLPPGIEIIEAAEVPLFFHLSSLPHPSIYWVPLDHLLSKEEAVPKINNVLDKKEFLVHQERDGKKRSVDIRPLIEKMEIKERPGEASQWGVELVVRRMTGRTAKPIEIIGAILGLEGEPLAQCKVIKLE
jgi:radical SAM-linked protein